jgi:hypothetical protein
MNQCSKLEQQPFETCPLRGKALPFVPLSGASSPGFVRSKTYKNRNTYQTGRESRKIGQVLILPDDETSLMYGEIPIYYSGDDIGVFLGKLASIVSKNLETPEMQEDWPMAENLPRLRKVGHIIILPDDEISPEYAEIPLYYGGDDPDFFLGKIVRSVSNVVKHVGRAAQKAVKTVGKAVDTVKRATGPLGDITDFAWRMSPLGQAVTWGRRGLEAASAVARGERIDRVLKKAAQAGIGDVRERLKFAEMVAPFIPGLGTGVAAALGAANALASGKPITEAVIAAARSAIPGGAIAQAGFDVATNLARGKSLSEAALAAARSRLPGGPAAQTAFDAGLALAQGRKLQDAAFAAAGRVLPPSPFAADALAFARAAASGKNLQKAALSIAGQRVLEGKKVNLKGLRTRRELEFEFPLDIRERWRTVETGPWIRNGRQIVLYTA